MGKEKKAAMLPTSFQKVGEGTFQKDDPTQGTLSQNLKNDTYSRKLVKTENLPIRQT